MPWNLWKKQVGTEFVFRKGVEFFSCLSFSPLIPQQKRAAAVHYGCSTAMPPHHAYLMSPKIAKMRPQSLLFSFFKSRFRAISWRPSILLVFSLFNLGGIQLWSIQKSTRKPRTQVCCVRKISSKNRSFHEYLHAYEDSFWRQPSKKQTQGHL